MQLTKAGAYKAQYTPRLRKQSKGTVITRDDVVKKLKANDIQFADSLPDLQ